MDLFSLLAMPAENRLGNVGLNNSAKHVFRTRRNDVETYKEGFTLDEEPGIRAFWAFNESSNTMKRDSAIFRHTLIHTHAWAVYWGILEATL